MHDPLVVAFEIRRPWPKRDRSHDARAGGPRWHARYRWATWTRPWRGWMCFWTVAGVGFYWPSLITVWHREPSGQDALTVCRTRIQRPDGTWKFSTGWVWHVHHWKIQVPPLQNLRRRLLTRCEECGRKGRPDVAHQWEWDSDPWWRGERGLFHSECSSLVSLRRQKGHDEALILSLVAELRVRSDETPEQIVDRLTGHKNPLPFHLRYRLGQIIKPKTEAAES